MYPYVCINTYERPDRRQWCQQLFDKLGWQVEFYQTHRNPHPGRGNYESHRAVARKYPNGCIVFEDDIVLADHFTLQRWEETLQKAVKYIKEGHCQIFYFGSFPLIFNRCSKQIEGPIFELKAQCAHAYLLGPEGCQQLSKTEFEGIIIDNWYVANLKAYAYLPSLIDQGSFGSDLDGGAWHSQIITNSFLRAYYHQLVSRYPYYSSYPVTIWFLFLILIILIVVYFCYTNIRR